MTFGEVVKGWKIVIFSGEHNRINSQYEVENTRATNKCMA